MNRPTPPLSVLLIEDEALLVLDMEAMVEDAGHRMVAEAASWEELAALADDLAPDVVFVDLQLAHGTNGLDVCHLIRQRWRDALIVFVTANPAQIPFDYCGAHGVIAKPFSRSGLLAAMRYIADGVCHSPPISMQPASFFASPTLAANWS